VIWHIGGIEDGWAGASIWDGDNERDVNRTISFINTTFPIHIPFVFWQFATHSLRGCISRCQEMALHTV